MRKALRRLALHDGQRPAHVPLAMARRRRRRDAAPRGAAGGCLARHVVEGRRAAWVRGHRLGAAPERLDVRAKKTDKLVPVHLARLILVEVRDDAVRSRLRDVVSSEEVVHVALRDIPLLIGADEAERLAHCRELHGSLLANLAAHLENFAGLRNVQAEGIDAAAGASRRLGTVHAQAGGASHELRATRREWRRRPEASRALGAPGIILAARRRSLAALSEAGAA
mmetsp:Transcript_93811/g.242386  ORF Transcript_93811/g.242386 Transcript_93811/m.242386 type:complete len:225 (-) Transcript_93811:191-865(-)